MHGGSLFYYVFVINKTLSVRQRTNFIHQQYLKGILNLIAVCEKEDNTAEKLRELPILQMKNRNIKLDEIALKLILFKTNLTN